MARVFLDYSAIRLLKKSSVRKSSESSSPEVEVVKFSDSESNESNENRWESRQFNGKRRACFICEKAGEPDGDKEIIQQQHRQHKLTVESDREEEHTADVDDDSFTFSHNKIRKCSFPSCSLRFHEKCFLSFTEGDFLPRMHVLDKAADPCINLEDSKKWICPQHECNFCHQELLRTRAFQGEFIRCVKCVFAWHRSCVIVGSLHINRKYDKFVLCPRHNTLTHVSKRNVPYCINCEKSFGSENDKVACSTCVRSFCLICVAKKKHGENAEVGTAFVCDFCRCFDFPRIGDYVLAPYKSNFWPARALHADLLPQPLYSKRNFVEKLEQSGYVLVQWIEGLNVPNYDVITYRDLVPFPKTLTCPFWKRMKTHASIYKAVKDVYSDPQAAVGIKRPLPPEVKAEKVPKYTRIKGNINMRLARARSDTTELGQCNCEPINGKRCTAIHGCLNRLMMTECPEDCDSKYLEKRYSQGGTKRQVLKKTAIVTEIVKLPTQKMCMNNFLRLHNTSDDDLLMEERPTEFKGFGVFAKRDISKETDLTEYMGQVMTKDEYFDKLELIGSFNNLEMSYFGMQLKNDFYVDARHYGSIARSFNHSCEPNCKVDSITVDGIYRLKVSTIKDVKAGEELTYDYDTELSDGLVGMECFCGSTNCRRIIGKKAATVRKGSNAKAQKERTNDASGQFGTVASAVKRSSETSEINATSVRRHIKRKRTGNTDEKERSKKGALSEVSRSTLDTVPRAEKYLQTTSNKENIERSAERRSRSRRELSANGAASVSVKAPHRRSRKEQLTVEEFEFETSNELRRADALKIAKDRTENIRRKRRMPEIYH